MKKLTYIAFVALVALTACTKVEMDSYAPDHKVTFQAAAYAPQTKANSSIWGEIPAFNAKAFLHAEGYTDEIQDFFGTTNNHVETITPYNNNGTAATAENNTAYWGPSHDYYWPKSTNSYLNFIAWYDKNGDAPSTATESSLSWENYEVAADDNLLYADEACHYNSNTANASQYTDDNYVREGVPMLFHHALAQVGFKANFTNGNSTNGYTRTVTVTSLTLSNVYSTGSLVMTNAGSSTTATVPWVISGNNWTPVADSKIFLSTSGSVAVNGEVNLIDTRSVLPQTVTSSMILEINYDIVTKKNGADFSVEHITYSKPLIQLANSIDAWRMGHIITYTIVFNLSTDSILILPTLENWDYNGGNVTVE